MNSQLPAWLLGWGWGGCGGFIQRHQVGRGNTVLRGWLQAGPKVSAGGDGDGAKMMERLQCPRAKQFSMSSAGGVRLQIHRRFPFHSKICFGPSSLVQSDGQTWLSIRQINVERLFEGSESRRVWICGVTAMLLISHFYKRKYIEW